MDLHLERSETSFDVRGEPPCCEAEAFQTNAHPIAGWLAAHIKTCFASFQVKIPAVVPKMKRILTLKETTLSSLLVSASHEGNGSKRHKQINYAIYDGGVHGAECISNQGCGS
jgi:hypothetical protein